MLVKDEADVIGPVVRHLAANVDHVLVADNLSTDGTVEILEQLKDDLGNLEVTHDLEEGYYQSRKMTGLAMAMLEDGHSWIVPVDADEVWYADGRPIKDFLAGLAPDVMIVEAEMHHHIPTALDPPAEVAVVEESGVYTNVRVVLHPEPNPFNRICWRKRARAALPKVAARLRPDLVIEAGNHDATVDGNALRAGGLHIRHYSWRTPEQYLRKIRNGERAYAATDLPPDVGEHWRGWADKSDEAILDHFRRWFFSSDPQADDSLIYDPVTPFLAE